MSPQKGQKCRKRLRKCEKLFTGGAPVEEREGDHKAKPRDVAMLMEEMRDSSEKKRFQKKESHCNPRIDKFKKVIFSTVQYYYN